MMGMKKTAGTLIHLIIAALFACTNPVNNSTKPGIANIFAGTGQPGTDNGAAGVAQFDSPFGVAVDRADYVYIADENNHMIRKITPGGEVSTYAGTGQAGDANGAGASAQFNFPTGVAVDSSGHVYVADYRNHLIRMITPQNDGTVMVSTFAGTGQAGTVNGDGITTARFHNPYSVAVDSSGSVYVADYGNHRIRKITPEGSVDTLAGSVQGFRDSANGTPQFSEPTGVAVDSSGNVYVADYGNNRIRKITPEGMVSTFAGTDQAGITDGIGTSAEFDEPTGVAVDSSGNVYVADSGNNRIRKITPEGMVSTFAGTSAQLNNPAGVAVDSSNNVYVADYGNHRIRKIVHE